MTDVTKSVTIDSFRTEDIFGPQDCEELQAVLSNKSVRRALGEILREAENQDSLLACDLSRPQGLNEALVTQGKVRGMIRALEILTELGAKRNE